MPEPSQTSAGARSQSAFERAARVLVGGVNSPVRAWRAVGGAPAFVGQADGPYIFDLDGHRYVDLVGSWGTAIVGHAHPAVVEAVQRAAERGLSFGACCEAEAELAETITEALPSIDLLRFVSSGTEAVMSALRVARAVTGKSRIVKFTGCYHGHADSLLVAAGSGAATLSVPDSAGVPAPFAETTLLAPYNDGDAVEALFAEWGNEIAAVLVEPVAGNMGCVEPVADFLERLRGLCDGRSCLLIFDEVMTGFRVAWGGHQNLCGIRPDLTCLGKVIGGGLPVAAYGGSRALMEQVSPLGPVYQAGTLSGNPLAMAAGLATLRLCREKGFYETLHRRSVQLTAELKRAAVDSGISLQSGACGGMFGLFFAERPVRNFDNARAADHRRFATFFHLMFQRGVWLPPSGYEAMFLSSAHGEDSIEFTIRAARDAFGKLRT